MKRVLLVLSALGAPGLAACGGDGGTGPTSASIAGTYVLRTINGADLPYTLVDLVVFKVELIAGSLVLAQGGTYTAQTTTRFIEEGVVVSTETDEESGKYTVSGQTITLTEDSDGRLLTGTVSGNTITVTDSGLTAVYRK